jgi:hypothetical protein
MLERQAYHHLDEMLLVGGLLRDEVDYYGKHKHHLP